MLCLRPSLNKNICQICPAICLPLGFPTLHCATLRASEPATLSGIQPLHRQRSATR